MNTALLYPDGQNMLHHQHPSSGPIIRVHLSKADFLPAQPTVMARAWTPKFTAYTLPLSNQNQQENMDFIA